MPKIDIDYSNTIFYKIFCKDPAIKGLYVGLTTNFVQRRHTHKQSCKNEKAMNHNCKLYNTIRNSGGWDNWQMEIIAFHNCADSYEARKKEQEYFEKLGATLNSIDPFPKPKIKDSAAKIVTEKPQLFCEQCKVYFSHWKARDVHNHTKKHNKMVEIYSHSTTENSPKIHPKFKCEKCHYICCKKGDFNKHLHSIKHNTTNIQQEFSYSCECGKGYNHRASLYNHKKTCSLKNNSAIETVNINNSSYHSDKDHLIMMIVKQNAELIKENNVFKTMMMNVLENGTNNTHTILI